MISDINRKYFYIVGIMVLIFLISANIAWLNPNPRFEAYKVPYEKIPFMWQYNADSGFEIAAAAYFPKGFKVHSTRINRPTYPFVVYLLGNTVGIILKPVVDLNPLQRAGIGYIILKLLIYILGGILLFKILKDFCGESAALFAVALTFFHSHSINYIATFHTAELQFITPIIIIFLFIELGKSYSTKKNILFSIIVGILMLAKQNYAIYLAVLAYAMLERRYKEVGISVISHASPLVLWFLVLKLYGLEYRNYEVQVVGGAWLYQSFIHLNPIEMIKLLITSFSKYLSSIVFHYNILIVFALFTAGFVKLQLEKKVLLFFLLCFAATWFQEFVVNKYQSYMTSDLSIFVFGISAYGIFYFLDSVSSRVRSCIVALILCSWLFINVIYFVNFPWIHPYDQKSCPIEKIQQKTDKYETGLR